MIPATHQARPTLIGSFETGDGRRLTYSAAGPARGFPVVYLHGAIGSPRWRTPELDAVIEELGVRYVVVNRPGFGGSDTHPERTVLSHARDVETLADALGWQRFSVLGVSAGAPYALACAWALGDRVAQTAAVSALPPPARTASGGRPRLRYRAPTAAFGAPLVGAPIAGGFLRALRLRGETPPAAMVDDYRVCASDWGFAPEEIASPVTFWHARRDRLVPATHARSLAATLPDARFELTSRGGHFFLRRRIADVIASLHEPAERTQRGRVAA